MTAISLTVSAQEWGLGLRLGDPTGINAKGYFGNNALEFTLGTGGYLYGSTLSKGYYNAGGLTLMTNYLWQNDTKVRDFQWYAGFGGTLRYRSFVQLNEEGVATGTRRTISLDANAVLGIEYRLPDLPLVFFIDVIPSVEILPHPLIVNFNGGFGARYMF